MFSAVISVYNVVRKIYITLHYGKGEHMFNKDTIMAYCLIIGSVVFLAVMWDVIAKRSHAYRTKKATKARFEFNNDETSGRAFTVERKKGKEHITISSFSGNEEEIESNFDYNEGVLNRLDEIATKYDLRSFDSLKYTNVLYERSFFIDYGEKSRDYVSFKNAQTENIKDMLDEIETYLKNSFGFER